MGLEDYTDITYKFESGDNLEAYMDKEGVPGDIQKVILNDDSITFTIKESGGAFTINTASSLGSDSMTFTPGEEFEHTTLYGKTIRGVNTVEGNKITHISSDNPSHVIVTEFVDDKLIINLKNGNVSATRIFRKA